MSWLPPPILSAASHEYVPLPLFLYFFSVKVPLHKLNLTQYTTSFSTSMSLIIFKRKTHLNNSIKMRMHNKKALQWGLWLIWLCGFVLIALSFYATQMLPSSFKDQVRNPQLLLQSGIVESGGPTIEIFTAPRSFTGIVGERQDLAVRSWLGLSVKITVVLFSREPSVFAFADSLGSRVSVEPNIDFTFLGTPFFHSMVARSQASSSDIIVLIDPDIILFPDFISSLAYADKLDQDWLLYASPKNTSHLPFSLDGDGKVWLEMNGKTIKVPKEIMTQSMLGRSCEAISLLAWNNGDVSLHKGSLPPFLFGKGIHYHWLITEVLSSDFRFVFDASWTISSFILDYPSRLGYESSSWEFTGNSHLAMLYGTMYFHEAKLSNLFRSMECGGIYAFVNAALDAVYILDHRYPLSLRHTRPYIFVSQKKISECIDVLEQDQRNDKLVRKNQLKLTAAVSLPYSLEYLLSSRADGNKTVVLAVAGNSYREMLMSWACRLNHLQISNYLVGALDDEIYEFLVLQGLPVFKYIHAPANISFDDCHFGTECFQKVSKTKSRVVLQILKLGFNVLMSDVDVYWFKNPLPMLSAFGPSVLVAQSDEFKITGPINLPRRLNSGFYYAHSDGITIAGLEKVVTHAAKSNLSEQPSFYYMLCGEGGFNRLGDNKCLEPETNLSVHFLDRDLFPNGAYRDIWAEKDVKAACVKLGCYILHNNWISGRQKKLERQILSGLWEYVSSSRMCLQSWQKRQYYSYF